MSSNTLIFLIVLGVSIGTMLYFVLRRRKESTPIPTPDPIPTGTPKPSPTKIPTPVPTPEPIERCACYVLSNIGQDPAIFSFAECQYSGILERTVLPGQVIFVCAKLNSVTCSDFNGVYSEAWGEDCPEECRNHP